MANSWFQKKQGRWVASDSPAGTVVNPGAGRMSASRLCAFRAASMPRVAPRSLSAARAAKYAALKPVVASDSMSLEGIRTDRNEILRKSNLLRLIGEVGGFLQRWVVIVEFYEIGKRADATWVTLKCGEVCVQLHLVGASLSAA